MDGNAGSRTESRIFSSNRFEKLEIDAERDASSNLGSSASGESMNKSSSSSSTSSTSPNFPASANSGSKGIEDRKPAKERSRNGRGSFRGRGSASKFHLDSVEVGECVKSSGHSGALKDDRNVLKGEDGGQKKRSPKQITFDLPCNGAPRVREQEQDGELCGNGQELLPAVAVASSSTTDSGVDSGGDRSPPFEATTVDARKKEWIKVWGVVMG